MNQGAYSFVIKPHYQASLVKHHTTQVILFVCVVGVWICMCVCVCVCVCAEGGGGLAVDAFHHSNMLGIN